MHTKGIIMLIFLFIPYSSFYGNRLYTNIKNLSMGQTGIVSAVLNPSGLSFSSGNEVYLGHINHFGLKELSEMSVQAFLPNKVLDTGLLFTRYGYEYYNENTIGINVSRKINPYLSFGIRINYHFIYIAETEDVSDGWSSDLGLIWKPSSEFSLGVVLEDIPWKKRENIYKEGGNIQVGFSYFIHPSFELCIKTEKREKEKICFKAGICCQPVKNIFFRAGINADMPAFGIGYLYKNWMWDVAVVPHTILGISTGIGLTYSFR